MDETPEQLELRIAQLKAEAEAARLQAEMFKLRAQLEQAKQQQSGTADSDDNTPPATSRWKGVPTPQAAAEAPEKRSKAKSPPAAPAVATGKAAPASHAAPATPQRRSKPAPAKTRPSPPTAPPDKPPPPKKPMETGKDRLPSAPPPLPTGSRDTSKRPETPKASKKDTAAATTQTAAIVATTAAATASAATNAATAAEGAVAPAIEQAVSTTPEPAVEAAAQELEPLPLGAVSASAAKSLSPVSTEQEQAAHARPSAEGVEEEEYEEEEEGRRSWATVMLAVPSWMVSLAFHVAVLLVAAFLTFEVDDSDVKTFLTARAEDTEDEVLEEIVFETEQDMEEFEIKAIPTPDLSPGAADFAEITGMDTTASEVVVGLTSTDPQVGEIGMLFGNEGQGMARAGEGLSGEFFGVKATGSRFVFVVDSSMSMKAGKFDAARQELLYAVSRLTEEQSFYVIFFDWDAYRMFDLENPEPRMLRAVPPNIYRLQQWLPTVELELKTNPYDSMQHAMKLMPDAIYILSDGEFTDKGRMVKWLKKENLVEDDVDGVKPVVTIHTIGFYTPDSGTLETLARTYGGTYRFVPKPPNIKKRGPRRGPGGMPIPRRP